MLFQTNVSNTSVLKQLQEIHGSVKTTGRGVNCPCQDAATRLPRPLREKEITARTTLVKRRDVCFSAMNDGAQITNPVRWRIALAWLTYMKLLSTKTYTAKIVGYSSNSSTDVNFLMPIDWVVRCGACQANRIFNLAPVGETNCHAHRCRELGCGSQRMQENEDAFPKKYKEYCVKRKYD